MSNRNTFLVRHPGKGASVTVDIVTNVSHVMSQEHVWEHVLAMTDKKCPLNSLLPAHEDLYRKSCSNMFRVPIGTSVPKFEPFVFSYRDKIRATKESGRAVLETPPTVAPSDWSARMRTHFTPKQIEYLRLRDRVLSKGFGRCWYCGIPVHDAGGDSQSLEIDHFIAKSLGGSDDFSNLVPACRSCNRRKRSRSLSAFRLALSISEFWFEREGLKP